MDFPAQEEQRDEAAEHLAALKANLVPRGIPTRMDVGSLAILHPTTDEQVDTIRCKRRPSDADAWWFWDCMGPISEAADVTGTAVIIMGNLRRNGIQVHA